MQSYKYGFNKEDYLAVGERVGIAALVGGLIALMQIVPQVNFGTLSYIVPALILGLGYLVKKFTDGPIKPNAASVGIDAPASVISTGTVIPVVEGTLTPTAPTDTSVTG